MPEVTSPAPPPDGIRHSFTPLEREIMKRTLTIATGVLVGLAAVAIAGAPASAHTPEVSVDCDSIELTLTGYPAGSTVGGTLDGADVGTTTFDGSFSSGPFALDPTVAHTWSIVIDSSDGEKYDKVITGSSDPDCIPEEPPVVPEKPEPVVTVEVGEDGDCETGIVTRYETPFTADWSLIDNVWVLGEPVAGETVITNRPATEVECPVEEPPTEEPPVVVPPVEEPPAVVTPPVEAPVTPPTVDQVVPVTETVDALPETGADVNPIGFLVGGILAFAGVVLAIAAKTRRRATK